MVRNTFRLNRSFVAFRVLNSVESAAPCVSFHRDRTSSLLSVAATIRFSQKWGPVHGRYTARFRYLCTHSFLATVLIPLGSCNGLQHYAALGLDAKGGAQVNLVPSSKPQDVYSGVCDVVKAKVRLPPRSIVCNGLHVCLMAYGPPHM